MTSLTAAPIPANPITTADRKRASYFGLKLPTDSAVDPNPRDAWPAWTDRGVWEVGPEPGLVAELVPAKLAINGFIYQAREIPAGECGTIAFEVLKVATNNHYAIIRNHFGQVTCDCPSYVCTHEGTAGMCKHGAGLVEAGLVPAPTPIPAATGLSGATYLLPMAVRSDTLGARRAARSRRFDPSPEEIAEAAQLFADLAAERVAYRRELAAAL